MHKDPNIAKRSGLVVPGGLVAVYSVAGMLYATYVRDDAGTCGDGTMVFVAQACRSAVQVLAAPLALGFLLVAIGALAFRSKVSCRRGHGSWAHFGLALLVSLVLVPAIGAGLSSGQVIERRGVEYPVKTLLSALAGVGLVALVPFVLLYSARSTANRCCRDRGCFEQCMCDEARPSAPRTEPEPEPELAETPPLETWAEAAPPPEPEPESWATPAPIVEVWRPVEPAPAAVVMVMATPPPDPAAPPTDAMASAAKWAEEDASVARDVEERDWPTPIRTAPTAAPANKVTRPSKKPAKKPAKKAGKKSKPVPSRKQKGKKSR